MKLRWRIIIDWAALFMLFYVDWRIGLIFIVRELAMLSEFETESEDGE